MASVEPASLCIIVVRAEAFTAGLTVLNKKRRRKDRLPQLLAILLAACVGMTESSSTLALYYSMASNPLVWLFSHFYSSRSSLVMLFACPHRMSCLQLAARQKQWKYQTTGERLMMLQKSLLRLPLKLSNQLNEEQICRGT